MAAVPFWFDLRVDNCRQNRGRNRRDTGNKSEEGHHELATVHVFVEAGHLQSPSNSRHKRGHFRKAVLSEFMNRRSSAMGSFYVKCRFAKMTGLPDKLTETPHTYASRGREWTS
jgi:hypothetical protein